jgi:hypothetical protein
MSVDMGMASRRYSLVPPMGEDVVDARQMSLDMGDYGMEDQHMDGLEGYEDAEAGEIPPHATPSSVPTIATGDAGGSSRRGKAPCWSHMTKRVEMQDGVRLVTATCNYCHKEFTAGSACGTGHLNRHVKKCLQNLGRIQGEGVQTQLSYASDVSVSNWIYQPQVARNEIARFIVSEDLPIRMGESANFERMIQQGF